MFTSEVNSVNTSIMHGTTTPSEGTTVRQISMFRPSGCKTVGCKYRPPPQRTRDASDSWWTLNACQRCGSRRTTPGSMITSESCNVQLSFDTPCTAQRSHDPATSISSGYKRSRTDASAGVQDYAAEVRRLQKRLSALQVQFGRMVGDVTEMAKLQDSSAAHDRLRVLSEQANKWCGSRDAVTQESSMLCVYDFFQGKHGDEQEAMLGELLKSLSCDQDHCRLVSVITRTLEARDAVQDIINTKFAGHILPCCPLDNMVSAILDYPSRLTDKCRLEFARWCDNTRIWTLKPGPYSMAGYNYSTLTKKFCESVAYKTSESDYKFIFSGADNDPDSRKLVNLMGPCISSIRAAVKRRTGESKAGFVSDDELRAIKAAADKAVGGVAKYKLDMDNTDLAEFDSQIKNPRAGEGEARMGGLGAGFDLPARLQWGNALHSICHLPAPTENTQDRQITLYALLTTLEECLAKALLTSERNALLLKKVKQLQLTSARNALAKTDNPLPEYITYSEAMDRVKKGDRILATHIHITSTMASHQAKLQRVHAVQQKGTAFVTILHEWLRGEMSVAGNGTPLPDVRERLTLIAARGGEVPLFDVERALARWCTDSGRRLVFVPATNITNRDFDGLQSWSDKFYTECVI